ncbi:MAG: RIP metalloprotease RseP [Bacilli bacterium]|nr:RIP metalloprotease RseP [Bacilli bacterium]
MTIIIFLIILGIIVFIHELGHFIFAKKAGIYVYEFSIGFGPKLFSFKRKNDETKYMIKLIPLGGYVAMAGEEDGFEDEKIKVPEDRKLYNKTWWQRFLVMIAGAMNNFILGILLLFIMGLIYGTQSASNELSSIPKDGSLYEAGARDGEIITSINGQKVKNYDDISTYLALVETGEKINLTIKNDSNKEKTYVVKPKKEEDGKYYYGISVKVENEKGFIPALKYAKDKFISIYKSMIIVIKSLFTGVLGLDSLSGPVGIYSVVGAVKDSFQMILYLTAYLSINIGFMNLIPFPAFDGGRVLFLIIEKIKGSRISPKVENTINGIGFIFLMILMVVVTVKDIFKLF